MNCMAAFWLTPIIKREPLVFGAARFSCLLTELFSFREKLQRFNTRLLPLFKANLLLSDDIYEDDTGGAACGSSTAAFSMSGGHELIFDGSPYLLSHCAKAF